MSGKDATSRARTCIVTGEILPARELVRFVIAPDGEIVPDLQARLPGRGFWVKAERAAVEKAERTNAFARAAKTQVKTPAPLADRLCALVEKRLSKLLGLASRAGLLVGGFSKIEALFAHPARARSLLALIEASDGAPEGARKLAAALRRANPALPVIPLFPARQLGLALGEELVVHAALRDGGLSRLLLDEISRYRRLAPARARAPESVIGARDPV